MPAGRVLSESDKQGLKAQLRKHCEQRWMTKGYKKTSIKDLCAAAGIAIGTFYALYPAKEDLFLETIESIQARLSEKFLDECRGNPRKAGFAAAMKKLYREYDGMPILYDINKPDYQSFAAKLSSDAMEKIKFDSMAFFRKAAHTAKLILKVSESEAYGVLSALLSTIYAKETIEFIHNHFEIFDYMIDKLIPSIFE